jgi:hypothetical protein
MGANDALLGPAFTIVNVDVKTVHGSTWRIAVDPFQNVAHLKRSIEQVSGVFITSQRLLAAGVELDDGQIIFQCLPWTGVILHLVPRF